MTAKKKREREGEKEREGERDRESDRERLRSTYLHIKNTLVPSGSEACVGADFQDLQREKRSQRREEKRTEQNRTEQNRTEQKRTEQNRTEQNRTEQIGRASCRERVLMSV